MEHIQRIDHIRGISHKGTLPIDDQMSADVGQVFCLNPLFNGAGQFVDNAKSPLQINFSDNDLHIEYAAPMFAQGAQYQRFLEGFDKNWSHWNSETRSVYTNLYEGEYGFRVRARDRHGHVSAESVFSFHVAPPWYRTWRAYVLYGALFIGILANGLTLVHISEFWQQAVQGLVILGAVISNALIARRLQQLMRLRKV